MLKLKNVTDLYEMRVFTDLGDYFGDIEDTIIHTNKVSGWKIRATKNSYLSKVLGSAKGVIVPHQMVKAIGDIFVISKSAAPAGGTIDDSEE